MPADERSLGITQAINDATPPDSFETLKARGNHLFKCGNYAHAQAVYQQCLDLSPESMDTLSNLSAVHLKLAKWAAALETAQCILASHPVHMKCLYRSGVAHLELQQYKQAVTCFKAASQQSPSDDTIKARLAEAKDLLQQSQGHFNPNMLYFDEHKQRQTKFASYTGPLTVQLIQDKGCGLVLTAPVRKGQLLAVCKPMAIGESKEAGVVYDPGTGGANDKSQADLIVQLHSLCSKDADSCRRVYALYDHADNACRHVEDVAFLQGAQTGATLPDKLTTDSSKIARLVEFNAFGQGRSSSVTPMDPLVTGDYETSSRYCMSAMYALLSMANHSCAPNSTYLLINDVAFVRAGQDMKEGEEITVSYHAYLQSHVSKRQEATANWGFKCMCSRCQAETSMPSGVHKALQAVRAQFSPSPCAPDNILAAFRCPTHCLTSDSGTPADGWHAPP